jgi:hypothetical protein
MDNVNTIRKEMRDIIDIMPEHNLYRLRPLLDALIESADYDNYLSSEEELLLNQCQEDREEHPETLTHWRKVRN